MSHYRGVFIAPSTINKRTHKRSKTYPHSRQQQYKSELSHLPTGESLSSLFSQRAPKIEGLLKPVTLRFRTGEKRETSTCELQCSSLGSSSVKSERETLDSTDTAENLTKIVSPSQFEDAETLAKDCFETKEASGLNSLDISPDSSTYKRSQKEDIPPCPKDAERLGEDLSDGKRYTPGLELQDNVQSSGTRKRHQGDCRLASEDGELVETDTIDSHLERVDSLSFENVERKDSLNDNHTTKLESQHKVSSVVLTESKRGAQSHKREDVGCSQEESSSSHQCQLDLEGSAVFRDITLKPQKDINFAPEKNSYIIYDFSDGREQSALATPKLVDNQSGFPDTEFRILPKIPDKSNNQSRDRVLSVEEKTLKFGKIVFPEGFDSNILSLETKDDDLSSDRVKSRLSTPVYQSASQFDVEREKHTTRYQISTNKVLSEGNNSDFNIKDFASEKDHIPQDIFHNRSNTPVSEGVESEEVSRKHSSYDHNDFNQQQIENLYPKENKSEVLTKGSVDNTNQQSVQFNQQSDQLPEQEVSQKNCNEEAKRTQNEVETVSELSEFESLSEIAEESTVIPIKPTVILENPDVKPSTNRLELVTLHQPTTCHATLKTFPSIRDNQQTFKNRQLFAETNPLEEASYEEPTYKVTSLDTYQSGKTASNRQTFEDSNTLPVHPGISREPRSPTFPITVSNFPDTSNKAAANRQTIEHRNTSDQEGLISEELFEAKLSPFSDNSQDQCISTPHTPIVFNFETEGEQYFDFTERTSVPSLGNSPRDTANNSGQVTPRSLSENFLEDFSPREFVVSPNCATSTPALKIETASRRLLYEPADIKKSSNFESEKECFEKKESPEEPDFEETKMASLPTQNVKAKKELLESREKIRQLEEKLLCEQKVSESKERTIKSLTKELKSFQNKESKDSNNNEDKEELTSKVTNLETDNRILANQIQMVEEANKKLYKELYETKTQLRFQERRSDDVGAQNTQTNRRISQVLQSSMDKSTGFTVFLHQMETELSSTDSVLRKLRAQRQALEEVLKAEEDTFQTIHFTQKDKSPTFLTEEVKNAIRSQFEMSLEYEFQDEEAKQLHCDERMTELENIINECLTSKIGAENEKISVKQKKIDLARAHVKAVKDIEMKFLNIKERSEKQIATIKGRISNDVKEISKEISSTYLAKQERKGKPKRKTSTLESPDVIRKKSVEEMACFDRAMRSMKSKSQVTSQDLSENEKEILSLNEKMRKTLDDKIQMSEELLETQSKIQELENRYAEKQSESESLEKELSAKRHEITEMAREMQEALRNITPEDDESTDSRQSSEMFPKGTEKEVQVNDLKDELMQTIMLLQTEQRERQEAIRMNEDLFLELENREQEISGLVMELERHKDKEKTKEANSSACKKLKEMINSVEHIKMKADLEQLQKELEVEMLTNEREVHTLQSELAKQQNDSESLIVLVDYYKDEMAILQKTSQEKSEASSIKDEGSSDRDYVDGQTVKNPLVALTKDEFSTEKVKQLEEDVMELQKALESESDVNRHSKEKLADLEDTLRKETQAKEYAYRRNRDLEDELRIKDLKLNNLASAVSTSQHEKMPVKETSAPVTTISELRSTMAQIQSENDNLSKEVDTLALDMEESVNHLKKTAPEIHCDIKVKRSDVLQSEEDSVFSEVDGKNTQIQPAKESPLVHLSIEKDKIVNELEQTIKTLENEVQNLRSENTLLENEAVDTLDNGLKVENKILRNQLKSMTNELAIARADEDDMKREFEHVELRSHEIQEELGRLASEKKELEISFENLTSKNNILSQELELLRSKIDVLEEEKKVITGEVVGIEVVDSKAFAKENENLKTDIAKITLDLKVNKEEVERLQSELQVSECTVKELEMTLVSLQKEKTSLEIQVDDLSFLNETHEKEVHLLKKKIGVLEQEIQVVEQDLAQRSEEVKEKLTVIEDIEKDNKEKEVEKQELEKKVKEKEIEFQKAKIAEEKQLKELVDQNCELQAQIKSLEMDSSESKQEQQRLERDLNELRDRLREADRKFTSTRDDKIKTEDSLGSMKNRVGQLQNELSEARAEIREKNEVIRKLNLKNSELQISVAQREEEVRREERLRMENMKALDALKMKMEKMDTDDKKQRDRLFSLKSACSEANEAYEIVKKQNLNLRNEMQDLKKKFAESDVQAESNKREKEKLEEQILNASRTIDDIRKYTVAREQSLSPDSALGISVTSLTELGSGPNSPNSECSDNLFNTGEEELKVMPQEQGLLCKMPTMIENFRAVVRDNELMKTKIVEIMNNKDKMNSQLQYYSTLSDDLQKEVGDKDRFLLELQTKTRMLEDELNDTKNNLSKVERDFASTASESDLVKTTLKVREDTVNELREKVELLEEKEKALELYSKSMSEKYHHEANQKSDAETANKNLQERNEQQKKLLESLEKKLSEYSSRPRRVSEPEVKTIAVPVQPVVAKKASDIAMATLEGKLESIVEYSEVLESSLMDVEMGYRNIQAENERLKREMIDRKEYERLKTSLEDQDKSFKEQEGDLRSRIEGLQEQLSHLENQNNEKENAMQTAKNHQKELLKDFNKLKENFSPLEEANAILKADLESLKEESKQAEELRVKLDTDLKLMRTKMREMEMTAEAYKEENSRLRSDIIALSEEKCEVECKVSEAERREKRLNDLINQERADRQELKQEHENTLSTCNTLQSDLAKARDAISKLEAVQNKTEQTNSEMELRLSDVTSLKGNLEDELNMARKNIQELEDRFKKAVDQEEILTQKLNKLGLENSRLTNICEQSQKRKSELERDVVEANGKNEDLEAEIEKIRIEKAGLLKEIAQKEETVESMETKKSELEEEHQKLTNDLYLSTKKVLSLQLNLESLRNDVTQLGKELRRLVLGSIGREARDEAEEKSMETDLEMSLFENEVVIQALRQTIKATERSLDMIRPEAKISEIENKLCQKDIDSVHREFAFLKDQLGSFRHSCQKLSDETKRLKEDVNNKDAVLQEAREKLEVLNEENVENKEKVLQLQSKCNGLEIVTAEYEQNAETATNDMIRSNQTIATLEATIAKQEQKKTALDKERLVLQERLNNLENNQRASKDEMRNDKKRIASLEVESSEKQGLARELEKIEGNFNELKLKYEDALKEREEVKAELVTVRGEIRLTEVELKNSKKDAENFKKHIVIEREMRQRVEQDLSEHVEELKTYKKNLNTLQRSQSKLEDDHETLKEKAKMLEDAGQTFKKQLEVQSVEIKRLKDSLTDSRNELLSTNEKLENTEKERKRLLEDLVHSDEQAKKLQDTCNELLREKVFATDKVGSLSETLDAMISSHEFSLNNLKQDLIVSNKDLSITKSSLERSQNRNEELLQEIKNQENKIKAMEEKKQELSEKYWDSQNQLSEAQSCMDSLRAETKDLKGRVALHLSKIEQLENTLAGEHEESVNTIVSLNEKISSLKTKGNNLFQEKDMLQNNLESTEEVLSKTSEELKQTAKTLAEKETFYTSEVTKRDQTIDSLKTISEAQRADLKKTKDTLRDVCRENVDLKERLGTTVRALDNLESKVNEQENSNVDALAEAQAKLKVVSKMKASNSGENFVELQSAPLLSAELDSFDSIDGPLDSGRDASIKEVVDAFHQTCMVSFSDNRKLQDKLSRANESNAMLEDSLHKERNIMAETKRYLHELEKKKSKLEEEVKKLRHRLETFKQKSIELERSKDDELCEVKGDKAHLDKENWALKEAVEELRAKSKETESERDRYAEEVLVTQKQVVEARADIKNAQEQIDNMQEMLLDMKKRTFELEAREKSSQQKIAEKEKELYASEMKTEELEKLYNNANEKKTELYAQMSKAEDKIRQQESQHEENHTKSKEMGQEIDTLKNKVSQLETNLGEANEEIVEAKDKIDELEIQRGSLQATNEILKHQLELSRSENEALTKSYTTTHDESLTLSKALNEVTINKDNLQTELQCLNQEKERLQDALTASECQLRESEDNLVKAFQESENLKRQMLKVQSTACAESVKLQGEFAKLRSELDSIKKEAIEKDKEYIEKVTRLKCAERESDSLKKELNDIHLRESELKLDYTTTNSKLQSYVLERECWEREVKTVLGEIEQQKNVNATKEHRLERLRMRYEQEIGFLSQRVTSLERELKVVQDAAEQQRHADEIAHKLHIESKDMEIDNLRMRLQATRIHTSDKNVVVDQMKNQLDERTSQINDLMSQMSLLKDSYNLELASVQADLKCSQMENLLKLRKDMECDNQLSSSQDSVSDLLDAIKTSRKESERLRHLLGSRMRQMSSLNRDINSKRSSLPGARSYGLYTRDNEGHLRD